MKKFMAFLLILCLVGCTQKPIEQPKSNYTIKYVSLNENYNWRSNIIYIARDSETKEIIPFGIGHSDGYGYAFIEKDRDFYIEKITYELPYSDIKEQYMYSSTINEMVARGIVTGGDENNFLPEKELTSGEAAGYFKNLFKDFKTNHKAEENELIKNEDFAIMLRDLLLSLGYPLKEQEKDFAYCKDLSEATKEAQDAYKLLLNEGYYLNGEIVENDFMDTSDDEYYLHPKNTVTKVDFCEMLGSFVINFLQDHAPAIKRDDAPQVEIPVLDGSTSTYDITRNIYYAFYHNPQNLESFPKAHSKTTNAYHRLIDGEADIIFVPDAGSEVLKYAEKAGVKLKFTPVANEALVFFTGNKNEVSDITTENLRKIYINNSIKSWKELGGEDKVLTAYCRNLDSGSHAQMEKFILEGKSINESIIKERTSRIMASILTDVNEYNSENKNAIALGYSLYYYYESIKMILEPVDLKLMSIDGIVPSEETISNGTYPYTTNYYAVTRQDDHSVDGFLQLMQGEFGNRIIESSGLAKHY